MVKYREIFIFVSGSTPQIITETIYALAVKKPPIYPDEIIVITTTDGAKIARENLEKKGILKALYEDYKIPPIELKFEIPEDKQGFPLSDIRTTDDNKVMADLINAVIKEKTKDDNNRLHCSIAGGRKTMSFYLGSALQLHGRAQDKLYHVLVTPEFESNRDFYYKPLKNQKIKTLDGRELNTDEAEITLAELPFVRLGDKTKISGDSYYESVMAGQDAIDSAVIPLDVSIDLSKRLLIIGDKKIKMQPIQLALYATMLKLKKDCKKKNCDDDCNDCNILRKRWDDVQKEIFKNFYLKMRPGVEIGLLNAKFFSERVASLVVKINNTIKSSLNDTFLTENYLIKTKRCYYSSRYYINIDKRKIKLVG